LPQAQVAKENSAYKSIKKRDSRAVCLPIANAEQILSTGPRRLFIQTGQNGMRISQLSDGCVNDLYAPALGTMAMPGTSRSAVLLADNNAS